MLVKIQARASMQHRFPIPLAASWRQGTTVLIANSALHRKHSTQENQEDELLIPCQGTGITSQQQLPYGKYRRGLWPMVVSG